jgi:hypothetical protein
MGIFSGSASKGGFNLCVVRSFRGIEVARLEEGGQMKFKDPVQARCPVCGHTSEQSVDDLLARRAKCSRCGRLFAEMSEGMHRQLDAWKEFIIAIHLAFEIERSTSRRFDSAVFEKVHCLQDLVIATEALLDHVPEPERHASAVDAVSSAYRAVCPQIPCPALCAGLADALRPHWDSKDFWKRALIESARQCGHEDG